MELNTEEVMHLAPQTNFVWGAMKEYIALYHLYQPNVTLSKYIPMNRDPEPKHDVGYWKERHADWVVYKCDKVTPLTYLNDPNIALDISNPEVIDWQTTNFALPAMEVGYNMLAVDNIAFENYFGACGVYKNGSWVQLYSGDVIDQKFHDDVISWVKVMSANLRQLPRPMGLAVHYRPPLDSSQNFTGEVGDLVDIVDAVVDGGGFTEFGNGFANETSWLKTVEFMKFVQGRGKAFYSINEYSYVDGTVLNWVIASYLMGKGHTAGVFVTDIMHYGGSTWFPEYGAQIGYPTNDMYFYQNSSSVHRRDYSNGVSLVNTDSFSSFNVSLPYPYYSLSGDFFNETFVVLNPKQGAVLLYDYIMVKYVPSSASGVGVGLVWMWVVMVVLCIL